MNDATAALKAAIVDGHDPALPIDDVVTRIERALDNGADWRAAMYLACICRRSAPLAALLDHGVPVDHVVEDGQQLLHVAADHGAVENVQLLVARGVAPDVRDAQGRRPIDLIFACRYSGAAYDVVMDAMVAAGCTPTPAHKRADLLDDRVRAVIDDVIGDRDDDVTRALRRRLDHVFVLTRGTDAAQVLTHTARDTPEQLPLLVEIVRRAAPAKATAKPKMVSAIAAAKTSTKKPLQLVHHGDVVVDGDVVLGRVVVTGTLTVHGTASRVVDAVVVVGGGDGGDGSLAAAAPATRGA